MKIRSFLLEKSYSFTKIVYSCCEVPRPSRVDVADPDPIEDVVELLSELDDDTGEHLVILIEGFSRLAIFPVIEPDFFSSNS